MSLLFMEGFDALDSAANFAALTDISVPSGAPTLSTSVRKGTGKCVSLSSGSTIRHAFLADQAGKTLIIGFAFKRTSDVSADRVVLAILDSLSGSQLDIRVKNLTHQLILTRNGTLLATGITPLVLNAWYYLELKFKVDNVSGTAELKLNENSTEFSISGVDTQAASTNSVAAVNFTSFTEFSNSIDDIYIFNTDGLVDNDYFGDNSIVASVLNGDNAVSWTATGGGTHYDQVNETLYLSDGSTTKISSSTIGQEDSFTVAAVPNVGAVGGIKITAIAQKSDTGGRSYEVGVYSGANRQAIEFNPGTNYGPNIAYFEDSNGAGLVWDTAKIDAMKPLVKITA